MSPLTEALVRLRQVADEHDARVGERSGFAADVSLVAHAVVYAVEQNGEMLALLRDYHAMLGDDAPNPPKTSLIWRTRELLARVGAPAAHNSPGGNAMDEMPHHLRDKLKAIIAKIRAEHGHDDENAAALEEVAQEHEAPAEKTPEPERP